MTNPLLSRVKLPGQIFQLPSKGIFYKDPTSVFKENVRNAEVEVRPMSGLLEVKIKTPSLLYSGRVIEEICKECVTDVIAPGELLTKDVEAIFVYLKIVTYGPNISVSYQHDCKDAKEHTYTYDLNNTLANPNNANIERLTVAKEVTLPNQQKVTIRPVRFVDAMNLIHLRAEIEAMELNTDEEKKNFEGMVTQLLITELLTLIEQVDEVTDRKMIGEWLTALPRNYWKLITDRGVELSNWGYDLTAKLKCKDCDQQFVYDLQLDPVRFFTG